MADERSRYRVVSLGPTVPCCPTCGASNPPRFELQHADPCAPKPVHHLGHGGIFGKDEAEEMAELLNEVLEYGITVADEMKG